ncbi:MAG: hypothetical protein ACP5FH_07175 [Terracidiphilus sp.]
MRNSSLPALAIAAVLLLTVAPSACAQTAANPAAQSASIEANRQALQTLSDGYWQALLEHAPEFASTLGDKRYNDCITDYSVQAENEWLEQEQNDLMQLAAIDPTGFTERRPAAGAEPDIEA